MSHYAAVSPIPSLRFPSHHVHLSVLRKVSSLRRPPATLYPLPSRSPHSTPYLRPFSMYTRKRRGDGKHVCAMRTGIAVSLFRGGSDVLFHPRRRQSCRIAKTYHTIVSKFAHSLISRSFLLCLSFLVPLSLSAVFYDSFSGVSLYIFIFFRFTSSLCFSLRFSLLHVFYFTHRRNFISRISSVREGVSWYARGTQNFLPFCFRAGPEDRVKYASCRLQL